MIRVVFIINNTKKLSQDALRVIKFARTHPNIECHELRTSYRNHATEIAYSFSNKESILVAVGGDGTAHEVLNGIMKATERSVFAILPCGTGNDFLRSTRAFDVEKFKRSLIAISTQIIDVGSFTNNGEKNYFLNIADVGFGAKVIEMMERQRKAGLGGKLSYSLAIVRSFLGYKKLEISMSWEKYSFSGKVLMVAFCNGSTFGHGLTINPKAKINSGKLELTVIGDISLIEYLKNLGKLKHGKIIDHPEVHYLTVNQIDFKFKNQNAYLEADGELYGTDTNRIEIVKNAIELLL